ncbi:MAG: mechanosensitive ion channel [Neomegalonema sp.]|nr:mechanosensitive ion channel [Neomegalonema sp.]
MDIENLEQYIPLAIEYGTSLLTAILILIFGFWFAGSMSRWTRRRLEANPGIDNTLAGFFASLVRYLILAVVVVAVLDQFGVETTSVVALLGAAGLAVGLALQGTLSHLAAGVMLIFFRPFKAGDYIDAGGHSGTVKEVSLFTTELATVDNVQIIMPNGEVWGSSIVNYSAHKERRVDLVIGVSYATDLKQAERAIRAEILADQRVRHVPAEPFVAVTNLGDSSVDFTLRVWCKASDYWGLRFDLLRKIKERFDAEGVDIPFPTTTIVQAK